MNRNVTIRIPKGSNIRQKIRDIYTELRIQWKQSNKNSTSYPVAKLRKNIINALSIQGKVFKEEQFLRSNYLKWGNGIVIRYSHFYWLVNFRQNKRGNIIADVIDVCYEGDYHNDTMNTTPYGECILKNNNLITEKSKQIIRLSESELRGIIKESVRTILKEHICKRKKGGSGVSVRTLN